MSAGHAGSAIWMEVGDQVYCRNYEPLDFNVGVVVGAEALLVVDTRADLIQARELKDDLAKLSSLPVGWVVNTHYHWDHTFGNAEFRDLPIWGHARCAKALVERGAAMKEELIVQLPQYAERFAAVPIVPPDRTFESTATLDLGDRTVTLEFLGIGHTDSDLVLTVSDTDAVFAGDLLESGAPPAFGDAFPLDWPHTVRRMLPALTGAVVPGHGPVVDRKFAETQLAELEEVARLARERHASGMDAGPAAAAGGPYPSATMEAAFAAAYSQLERGR